MGNVERVPQGGKAPAGTKAAGTTPLLEQPPATRPLSPGTDTAVLSGKAPPGQEGDLAGVVARARAAAAAAPPPAKAPSLAIPGVPTGQALPVTVKAAITVKGTAKVLEMSDDACEIRIAVKGRALFVPIERDYTVSIRRQADGTYLYRTKDNNSGEVSEGKASDLVVDGKTKRFSVQGKDGGDKIPVTMTDLGGGRFRIVGEGFDAEIDRV